MTPEYYAPDPWPENAPRELDDAEYARALATVPTPDTYDVERKLFDTPGPTVVVWVLLLGTSYSAESKAGRADLTRGYFIRAIVRDKAPLRSELIDIARSADNEGGQLELVNRMLRPEGGTRWDKVVGWAFARQ